MAKKYYAVKVGKKPGIYLSWDECHEQINGVSGAVYKGFSSPTEAQNFLNAELEKTVPKAYYAVKVGKIPGIYTTWEECNTQIEHFPNASYKKFPTLEDAKAFMGEKTSAFDGAVAYVGGSCENDSFTFGYGVVIKHDNYEQVICGSGNDQDFESLKSVAGEMIAATKAMEWCITNKVSNLRICYTYDGVEKWCTGEWKPNNIGAKKYMKYFGWAVGKINIVFKKTANGDINIVNARKASDGALGRRV